MLLSKVKIRKITFVTGFYILLFYDFHRYIFKYNSEGTSPTYTNTPIIWKVSKYLIIILILLVHFTCLKYCKEVKKIFVYLYSIVLFILTITILNIILYHAVAVEEIEYCFWFLFLIPYLFTNDSVFNLKVNYNKLLTNAAIILIASNLFAIVNYYLTGRLPALGYEDGLVRFGGFWDDPNSFGIVCVFFFFYFQAQKRYFLSIFSLINVLPTFSFTAYILFIVSCFFWIFSNYFTINKKWTSLTIIIILAITIFAAFFITSIINLYEIKAESVTEHLTKKMIFSFLPLQNSPIQFSENWYESSFYNYFPVSIIIHGGILLLLLSLFKNSSDKLYKFYIFIFITSSFFFSMLYIFPLNFIFIFLLIDYVKKTSGFERRTQELFQSQ